MIWDTFNHCQLDGLRGVDLLQSYKDLWEKYLLGNEIVHNIFYYMVHYSKSQSCIHKLEL